MELSDKTLQNLIALSAGALKGQQINVEPAAMCELWQDVAQADAYLKAKKADGERGQSQHSQEHA